MRINIDFGFGFLKACNDTGQKVIFPSVAGEMQSHTFSLSSNDVGLGITTVDGSWLFGQSAMEQSTLSSRQQADDWILTDVYKAGVLMAITELTKASRIEVELTLALPYETTLRKDLLSQLRMRLQGEHIVKSLGGDNQRVIISFPQKFPIVPQNIAPVLRHFIDKHGNLRLPQTSDDIIYIGLGNGGSHTFETSTCRIDLRTHDFKALKGRSEPIGTYALSETIRPLLQAKFQGERQVFKKDHKIFEAIRSGHITLYNQSYDVGEIIDGPVSDYRQAIISHLGNVWSDTTPIKKPELFAFIGSGGGAYIFDEELKKWHPNVVVSDDPQNDVVEGMRRLRKMLDKENG